MVFRSKWSWQAVVLGAVFGFATHAAAQNMTGVEIMAALAGKPLAATLPNGGVAELQLGTDGNAVATGAINDRGLWWPTDTGYCSQWNTQSGGQVRCFTVVRRADGGFDVINPAGALASTVRIR